MAGAQKLRALESLPNTTQRRVHLSASRKMEKKKLLTELETWRVKNLSIPSVLTITSQEFVSQTTTSTSLELNKLAKISVISKVLLDLGQSKLNQLICS
jgi:IS4 transposase